MCILLWSSRDKGSVVLGGVVLGCVPHQSADENVGEEALQRVCMGRMMRMGWWARAIVYCASQLIVWRGRKADASHTHRRSLHTKSNMRNA